VAVRYQREETVLEAVFNLSPEFHTVPLAGAGSWGLALSTDAPEYGGRGGADLRAGELRLPDHTAVLLRKKDAA
jgi:hypothetical protein